MAPALVAHPWVRTPLAVGMAVLLAGVLAFAAARLWPVRSTVTNGADLSPQTIVAQAGTGAFTASSDLRDALAASRAAPADTSLALQAAELLIAEGRTNGDARLVGASLGILQPALALGINQALILAAIARQYQHDFTGSLALLDRAIDQDPRNVRAVLTRARQKVTNELDPVGENLVGTRSLVAHYQALGMSRIETRYYAGARHELLNETNRDEVQRDVLAWLAKTV